MCRDGHPLSFVGYDRLNLVYKGCVECGTRNLTRSYCETCGEGFCSGCRYPKRLTTVKCPLGHPFLVRTRLFCVTCDFCSESTTKNGQGFCYNDPKCDYAVCLKCFGSLEKENKEGEYDKEDPNLDYRT